MKIHSKSLIFTALCCFFTFVAFAQKKELKTKFGKVSDEEINMTSYKEDSDAPAVILFDKGSVYYSYDDTYGWTQIYERHKRIKIFKKDAYDEANISFPFFSKAKTEDIKGITYNLEGGKIVETKLNSDNIVVEKLTKSRSVTKMTLPAVKEGSIIEYKYTIRYNNAANLPDWYFQDVIPTIWSEFEAEVPEMITYSKISQGYTPFLVNENSTKGTSFNVMFRDSDDDGRTNSSTMRNVKVNYNKNTMRYVQANVPALKRESFINSVYDYLSRIVFEVKAIYNVDYQLIGTEYSMRNTIPRDTRNTWQDIGKEMYEDVYDNWIGQSKFVDDAVAENASKLATDKEKLAAIYDFFGKNFQTREYDYIFPSQEVKECASSHKGTPTDINLLFISYLKKVGLKASPLMLSTRKNGKLLTFYPNLYALNRVITVVTIDDKDVLVDASDTKLPIGLLPMQDINGEGLLLKSKTEVAWLPLENKIATRTAAFVNFAVSKEGKLNGTVTISTSGYNALLQRQTYKEMDETKAVQTFLEELATDGTITEKKLENLDKWQEPNAKETYTLSTSAFVNVSGDKIYLSPALIFSEFAAPFKEEKRVFDINFLTTDENVLSFTYQIPEGYKLESVPKSTKMMFAENGITFDYLVDTATPNVLKINIRNKIKRTNYSVEEYSDLKTFFTSMAAKLNEQVVISK